MDENKEVLETKIEDVEDLSGIVTLPGIAYRGKALFPNIYSSINIGRTKSLKAIETAMAGDSYFFVAQQKDNRVNEPAREDFFDIGIIVRAVRKYNSGGNVVVNVECLERAKILVMEDSDGYLSFTVSKIYTHAEEADMIEIQAAFNVAKQTLKKNFANEFKNELGAFDSIMALEDVDYFINASSYNLPFSNDDKYSLLECVNLKDRIQLYLTLLNKVMMIRKEEEIISNSVKESVEKGQKEFYLREQLKAIHKELGDDEKEVDTLEEQIKGKGMSKENEDKCLKELFRMRKMSPQSPDYSIIRNYIDWIVDLPFKEESVDTELLSDCERMLEEDHFGLDKVKRRIVEYLAVLKLTKSLKGPILCLVGPPGVGKTSIAKSVARALNRKLVRMSLGGVKDEAEVRGHRKTYIGAMPGRIIFGMKEAGTINPVFLLDEIDKVSSDMRGDPASALLEVLDPEQNSSFRDRFLEIPYDLSKVMFITTANTTDTIPGPLLDRMEVIEISGYTQEEKIQIGKKYLVPKQIAINGLKSDNLEITEDGIRAIIEGYTGEAGVRKLEQLIGSVCRKVATKVADDRSYPKQVIGKDNIQEYLGNPRYLNDDKIEKDQVGSATGLAWTLLGGTTLTIEVALMKGKGNIQLTGKLGDVMQESAKTAISYIRSKANEYGIDSSIFETTDVHLHVPEGATPKDGPSAGITIATALLSTYTNRKVKRNIAMTGEITLRGNVLPIGGLKEKSLAAYRIGIRKIIIPKANVKDLEEIPEEIRNSITFVPVESIGEVFKEVLYDN